MRQRVARARAQTLGVPRVVACGLCTASVFGLGFPPRTAAAQQSTDDPSVGLEPEASAETRLNISDDATPAGLLPIPDYTSDLWTRPALLGDLGGVRTSLAEQGIQFGIDWNNTLQSVASGGRDTSTAYGGTLDYNLTLDLMRMGLVPGGLVKLRGESRYGESINGDTGSLLPVNSDFFFPLSDEFDGGVPFYLTTLSYTQFFSDSFAIFAGKFDTLDGDPNEFAGGRGLTQFQNWNFLFTTVPLVTVPYSTLGAGIVFKPDPNVTLTSSVITTADSSSTTGFNRIGDGWTWTAEAQVQYRVGKLPGGFNVGGTYAWDNDFATTGRRFIFRPGEGVTPTPGEDTSWAMFLSMWQYLFVENADANGDAPMDLANGRPDLQGVGLFARAGFADNETNPTEFAFSVGVGGRGIIPGRDEDLYGVGYFRNEIETDRVPEFIGAQSYYQGFEAFYNVAITPAAGLTLNIQAVEPATERLDTAVVLGMRLLLRF